MEELLGFLDVSRILGVPARQVLRMISARQIPFVKFPDGDVRFEPGELAAWIESRRQVPVPPAGGDLLERIA